MASNKFAKTVVVPIMIIIVVVALIKDIYEHNLLMGSSVIKKAKILKFLPGKPLRGYVYYRYTYGKDTFKGETGISYEDEHKMIAQHADSLWIILSGEKPSISKALFDDGDFYFYGFSIDDTVKFK